MTPSAGDIMAFTGAGKHVVSTSLSGDIGGTFTSSNISTITADYLLASTASTITIVDITGFPISGFIKIDSEIFSYSGTTPASNRFDGVVRTKFLTVAADHFTGATVIGLDNSSINLQIQSGAIENTDINATAAIEQSKLAMVIATTRASAPTGTAAVIQAASGLASFDSANFEITDGFVGIKNKGIVYAEIQDVSAGSILGNLTGSAASVQEVTTSGIVQNGINSLFTAVDDGAFVMTRRVNSLKTSSSFITIAGVAISGSGNFLDIPVSGISGSGSGARVTVGRSGGSYSGVAVTYGGQGYAEGDQLFVSGLLLGGATPANDLSFTVETTGTNIDTVVYLGIQSVSQTAAASSIVKTDALSNLGNSANQFNTVYASTFIGNLTGTASSATKATNLAGGLVGYIPYQSAVDATTFLAPGTAGRYLKSQGTGLPPIWNDLVIPDGDANTLTGTTLASGVVNSSLTSVGTLTSLTISGNVKFSVANTVVAIATGTGTALTKDINIVITCPVNGKVQLPVAVAGYKIFIRNNDVNDLTVYPSGTDAINDGAGGDPAGAPLVSGSSLEFVCGIGTGTGAGGQWYTLNATFA